MMAISYYGKALNARGQIEQVFVTKEPGKPTLPRWTGKTYRSDKEADRDITALNVAIAQKARSFERMMGQ